MKWLGKWQLSLINVIKISWNQLKFRQLFKNEGLKNIIGHKYCVSKPDAIIRILQETIKTHVDRVKVCQM